MSRTIQTAIYLNTTKSNKEDGKLSEKDTQDVPSASESKSDTAKNLFDALAGMKVSKTLPAAAGGVKKERSAGARSNMQATRYEIFKTRISSHFQYDKNVIGIL